MTNADSLDCYLPENDDQMDYGPIKIENYLGTLDTLTASAFAELLKIVASKKQEIKDALK